MWVRQLPNYFHIKCFKQPISLAFLAHKRAYVRAGPTRLWVNAFPPEKPPGRVFVPYSGNSDWISGPVRATVVFMPERYISDVMRIIKPEAAAHTSDEPIIDTWYILLAEGVINVNPCSYY